VGTIGLIESESLIMRIALSAHDSIFVVGYTHPEMGGSEYFEFFHKITGGMVPRVDLKTDKQNRTAVLNLIRAGLVTCAHDCSKGGIAVALAEMAIAGSIGFKVDLDAVPNSCNRIDELLFSETHSRYVIATKESDSVHRALSATGVPFAEIGKTVATNVEFVKSKRKIIVLSLKQLKSKFHLLEKTM
jgi:phosphoribosylformylglycinamidine synthase subunit PurL